MQMDRIDSRSSGRSIDQYCSMGRRSPRQARASVIHMKKGLWYTVSILLLALLLLGYAGLRLGIALKANALLVAGEYAEARVWFEKNNNTGMMQECDARLNAEQYADAKSLMDAGRMDEAKERFIALGGYMDAPQLAKDCDYQKALSLIERKSWAEGIAVLEAMEPEPRVTAELERVRELMYAEAERLTNSVSINEAAELWRELGDRGDSEYYLDRCTRLIELSGSAGDTRLLSPEKLFVEVESSYVYSSDVGYIVVTKDCGEQARCVIYYPGGWDDMISLDFLYTYIEAPPSNSISLFLYKNALPDDSAVRAKTAAAIDTLELAALERGVFVRELTVCGSSMGAYPELRGIAQLYRDYGISADCGMVLDAGYEWDVPSLLPNEDDNAALAESGVALYLLEGYGVGMDKLAIRRMVEAGCDVTVVVCSYDDHEAITFDALGMGIIGWSLSGREQPCEIDRYSFIPLTPESTYPY